MSVHRAVGRRRQHLARCGALSFDAVHCLSTPCPASSFAQTCESGSAARRCTPSRPPQAVCVRTFGTEGLFWKELIWVSTRCPSGFLGRLFPGNSPGNSAPSSSPRRFPTPSTLNPNPSPPTFLFSHKHARTHCIALPLAYAAFPIPCCALTWLRARSHFHF